MPEAPTPLAALRGKAGKPGASSRTCLRGAFVRLRPRLATGEGGGAVGGRTEEDWAYLADVLEAMTANARRVALGAVAQAEDGDVAAEVDAALRVETEALLAGMGPTRPTASRAVAVAGGAVRDLAARALAGNEADPAAALGQAFDALGDWLDAGGRERLLRAATEDEEGETTSAT
jgi:hypothetical protein